MRQLTKFLLAFSTLLNTTFAFAQNQDDTKAMIAYMTPGEVHKMLAKSEGTWTGAISMWMQPGAQPVTMSGDSKIEMILGGRYLQEKSTGVMMGMPFEGQGTTAYDNAKKIFITTWIDNAGTGMMYLEGKWDPANKSIDFSGKMVDPSSGKDLPVREVLQFADDNTRVLEMYLTVNG
ncbi:MAG TPA: DUF1579 domain-containing protein, partial [Puia sp.]|nr:DUF1579 domain-containing protein [Puia sp.]